MKKVGEPVYVEKVPMKKDQLLNVIGGYDAFIAGVDEITSKVIEKRGI
ncbi:MAG: hypothetical protein QW118_05105 [Nitrososphaerota archaeon]